MGAYKLTTSQGCVDALSILEPCKGATLLMIMHTIQLKSVQFSRVHANVLTSNPSGWYSNPILSGFLSQSSTLLFVLNIHSLALAILLDVVGLPLPYAQYQKLSDNLISE